MAKIIRVKSARKEHKCSRCHCDIHKGDSYLRAEINFGPTIVRCTKCGLESWEVTTSDYQLRIGEVVYRWSENYECSEEGVQDMRSELEDIQSELQDRLDNMPEGLQEGEVGQLLSERIDNLDSVMNDLDEIDFDDLKNSAARRYLEDHKDDDEKLYGVDIDDLDRDDYDWCEENLGEEAMEALREYLEEDVNQALEDAFSNIDI